MSTLHTIKKSILRALAVDCSAATFALSRAATAYCRRARKACCSIIARSCRRLSFGPKSEVRSGQSTAVTHSLRLYRLFLPSRMDRARAAGYIDNNFVQNQQRIRKRKDHLARIKKIMTRKPGSSVTLDNNPPVVQQATAEDPRKKAKKGLFSVIIERENKVLLQRISAILTEPARNTVKEYDAMKKLIVPKNQGKARAYDQHMQKVRNDKFFANLRNQKPVYSVTQWEKDYEHQKYNQRFMREVKYSRPPGFVDPFAPTPAPESPERKGKEGGDPDSKSPGRESNSSAHVHRIRTMKNERSSSSISRSNSSVGAGAHRIGRRSPNSEHHGEGRGGSGSRDRTPRQHQQAQHQRGAEEMGGSYDGDDFEDEDDFADDFAGEEFRELLAEVRRDVRVSEELPVAGGAHDRRPHPEGPVGEVKVSIFLASADVRCWLVNNEVIVLSAVTAGEGRELEAEAEISLEDLAVLRGEEPGLLGSGGGGGGSSVGGEVSLNPDEGGSSVFSATFDLSTLQQIAQEMVAHVEIRVDADSGARLILNLVSEEDPLLLHGTGIGELDAELASAGAGDARWGPGGGPQHGAQRGDPASESLVSEDELGDMLIDDNRTALLTVGTRVPVHFENQVITASVANLGTLINAAKIKNRQDFVYALVKVVSTEEDQLAVTLNVMTNTVTQFKRFARPAVVKGTILKIGTALPSVIHADPELVYTFAQNMVSSLKIVHSNRTGKNSLTVENVG